MLILIIIEQEQEEGFIASGKKFIPAKEDFSPHDHDYKLGKFPVLYPVFAWLDRIC